MLNTTCRIIFFHAYIQSIIDYASTLWDQAPKTDTNPISSIHKRAIKSTLLKSSNPNINDYKQSGILPLNQKLTLNKAIFMHKIINKNAPAPLVQRFRKNNNRNNHNAVEICPNPKTEIFKKSLHYSGGSLWNALPEYLRETKSLTFFTTIYKRFLLESL